MNCMIRLPFFDKYRKTANNSVFCFIDRWNVSYGGYRAVTDYQLRQQRREALVQFLTTLLPKGPYNTDISTRDLAGQMADIFTDDNKGRSVQIAEVGKLSYQVIYGPPDDDAGDDDAD
jgi:hypothetical protein